MRMTGRELHASASAQTKLYPGEGGGGGVTKVHGVEHL